MSFFRFLLLGKFSEIALWLRISRVSQPQKNPANLKGEFGDSCNRQEIGQILRQHFILGKKILPFQFLSVYEFGGSIDHFHSTERF